MCGFKWTMLTLNGCPSRNSSRIFNPGPSKQAQEVIFSLDIKVTAHFQRFFNNHPVH